LPALPHTLTNIDCNDNQLTELPQLPHDLAEFGCEGNQLTELPQLPHDLLSLDCNNNKLTELPLLPDSLTHLFCEDNQLTGLPELPPNLEILGCKGNPIKKITNIPQAVLIRNIQSIDPNYLDINSSILYKTKLQSDIRLCRNISIPINEEKIKILNKHIDKLNLNLLSRPEIVDGSIVDPTGQPYGNRGVQLGSLTTPDDQLVRVNPDLIKKIGSYFGGKSKKQRKYKKSKNRKSKKIRKKSKY
jgi:hypothetical protein